MSGWHIRDKQSRTDPFTSLRVWCLYGGCVTPCSTYSLASRSCPSVLWVFMSGRYEASKQPLTECLLEFSVWPTACQFPSQVPLFSLHKQRVRCVHRCSLNSDVVYDKARLMTTQVGWHICSVNWWVKARHWHHVPNLSQICRNWCTAWKPAADTNCCRSLVCRYWLLWITTNRSASKDPPGASSETSAFATRISQINFQPLNHCMAVAKVALTHRIANDLKGK